MTKNYRTHHNDEGFERLEKEAQVRKLLGAIDWLTQTIHRAHHDGALEQCPRATCRYALDLLSDKQ